MKYYESQGLVEAPPFTFPGYQVNLPLLQNKYIFDEAVTNVRIRSNNEKLPYNICLYKNMYKFKYLAILDFDEIFVPQNNMDTWSEMMTAISRSPSKIYNGTNYMMAATPKLTNTYLASPQTLPQVTSWRFPPYFISGFRKDDVK